MAVKAPSPAGSRLLLAGLGAALFFVLAYWVPGRSERLALLLPALMVVDLALPGRRPAGWRRAGAAAAVGILGAASAHVRTQASWGETLGYGWLLCGIVALPLLLWAGLQRVGPHGKGARPAAWALARGVLFLALALPYLFTAANIHRVHRPVRSTPAALGLAFEPISLRAADGVRLRGWFVPAAGSDRAALLLHGIGANREELLPYARLYHDAGFHVCMVDFRGHGESSGHTVSFGFYEARDVAAAVAYLAGRPDVRHIAAEGFSMGGATLLLAAPDVPRIEGVIADSAFADLQETARASTLNQAGPLGGLFVAAGAPFLKLGAGMTMAEVRPAARVGKISPRPLLIIHGTADRVVPYGQAQELYRAAREPKELWTVPGAGHLQARWLHEEEYRRRVITFAEQCVGAR